MSMISRYGCAVARVLLFIAGVASLGVPALALRVLDVHALTLFGATLAFGAPVAIGVVLVALAWRVTAASAGRLVIEFTMFAAALLLVQLGLTAFTDASPSPQREKAKVARKLGIPFDLRFKSQVVAEMRSRGVNAYPGMARDWFRVPAVRERMGSDLRPLSQVANSRIVECNETGKYMVYPTDEYGFNNPAGLISSGRPDIVVVGSSYSLGHCVPEAEGYIARVREKYPRIVNLGMAGGQALSLLASFREYVELLRPRLVIWEMYPGNVGAGELADPTLSRYLEPDFSQHLFARHLELDQLLRGLVMDMQADLDRKSATDLADFERQKWRSALRFTDLRERLLPNGIKAALYHAPAPPPAPRDAAFTASVIWLAKQTVESWGGSLVVVLTPTFEEVVAHQTTPDHRNARMLEVLNPLHVHVINGEAYFARQRDPASLFNMGINNHLNVTGHRLFGDYVVADLSASFPDRLTSAR